MKRSTHFVLPFSTGNFSVFAQEIHFNYSKKFTHFKLIFGLLLIKISQNLLKILLFSAIQNILYLLPKNTPNFTGINHIMDKKYFPINKEIKIPPHVDNEITSSL